MTGDLLAFDREHLWHPYSSMTSPSPVYPVRSAAGVRLRLDVDGSETEVVDAMSSWWCAIHGYAVPALDDAVRTQLDAMSHVMFGGLTHEPAVALGRRLVERAPAGLDKVFFADSGSVSVEVAMKMAWQAQYGTGRTRFFTIRGGYHGDTFSPMSVTDPDGGMHALYTGIVPEHVFADQPPAVGADLSAWKAATTTLFEQHADRIAAVIVEPVLQGAGGMHVYDPEAVRHLAELARAYGALIIVDEIATGLHRTGPFWGIDHAGITPDILCLGKALTGGYLTLAAVLTTAEVAARVDASPAGAMMHGPTFMANPLACAVAGASLDLLDTYPAGLTAAAGDRLRRALEPARELAAVGDVRGIGAVGVVALSEPVDVGKVTRAALTRGVWVRPFRNLVYAMPPYVCTDDDLDVIASGIVGALEEVYG